MMLLTPRLLVTASVLLAVTDGGPGRIRVGGLRSAILADAVQSLVMIGCSIVIIIHGFFIAKGPLTVFEVTKERDRLDPTLRVSTLSATLGQLFMTISMFGCQQNIVQRYFSMESQKQVEKSNLTVLET